MNPINTQTSPVLSPERELGNLLKIFPTTQSLMDFLIHKDPSDIAKIFKSLESPNKINFKKITNTIVELIGNYTVFKLQLDTVKELLKTHFPNEDLKIVDLSFKKITDQFALISQKTPISHDNYLLTCFPNFDKLINFLSAKDICSIQKIFKSDGKIENFLNSIEKLIINYEENETLTTNQWNCCYELIKVIVSKEDINKLEILNKKIEKRLYTNILSKYTSPKSAKALRIATLESIKILFDKLVKENTELKHSRQNKIDFLKQIITLNEQESKFSKILKSHCSFLSMKTKQIRIAKCEAKIVQGKLSYPISEELIKLLKSNPHFQLLKKNEITYIALKNENVNLISELEKIYKIHPETQTLIEKFIALLKRNFLNLYETSSFFEKVKYKKNDFHKNYFPLLFNNHDALKNSITRLEKNFKSINGVEDELTFSESFQEDLASRRSYFKKIQTIFSELAKIELEILKNPLTKDKKLIKDQMNIRQQFYNMFPQSFYPNLAKYQDFISQAPDIRHRLLNYQMNQKDSKALCEAIALECNLMQGVRQLVNHSKDLKKYEEMDRSDISKLNEKLSAISSLSDKFVNHSKPFMDNKEFICSFLPTYLAKENHKRFVKLLGNLTGYTISRVIQGFREIDFLYQKNCYSQKQLFCKALGKEDSHDSFTPEKNESLAPKIFPVEEILTAQIQEKEHQEKSLIKSEIETSEAALNSRSSKKPKSKVLHKSHKLLEKSKKEQPKPTDIGIKKKTTLQYFNTLSQAVKVTPFGKTELFPQSSISLLYPQKKQIDYLSSEFHSSPLPGTSPSWKSTNPRVERWSLIPKLPLCPETFPEYPDRGDNQAIQRFYHTIPKIAHRFIETLGAKQKITQISPCEHTPNKKKTIYTAIAKLSAIQQNADDSYSVIGEPIDGFYGIGISKGVLFHDAFSTQSPSERLARSNRTITPTTRFEDENFCVDVYESGEKTYKVSIDDKILMKRLEIFRTKHIHNVK